MKTLKDCRMNLLSATVPKEVIHELILPMNYFPNNARYPLLIYQQVLNVSELSAELIKEFLKQNHWLNSWVDSIYDYHHYHSNTHEALVVLAGACQVQIGGPNGRVYSIVAGDVVILPAGVAHKNVGSSVDFKCLGSYPNYDDYDMNYGKVEEHPQVDINIKKVLLPKNDPVFGSKGLLFQYWK
jgi:uncharacterized protein YjlB